MFVDSEVASTLSQLCSDLWIEHHCKDVLVVLFGEDGDGVKVPVLLIVKEHIHKPIFLNHLLQEIYGGYLYDHLINNPLHPVSNLRGIHPAFIAKVIGEFSVSVEPDI